MEFDKSRVYTTVNAEELKVGSIIVAADNLENLERKVENSELITLVRVEGKEWNGRFYDGCTHWHLAYLVDIPEPLKWTDLKVGDVITNGGRTAIVTEIDNDCSDNAHIYAGHMWFTNYELKNWEKVED